MILWGLTGVAAAFPWMIAHDYDGCVQCHVDPLGAGTLTAYGRAQSEILVQTPWGGEVDAAGPATGFLFGAVTLPEGMLLQGEARGLLIPEPGDVRAILMQADLRAAIDVGRVVASASVGVVSEGAVGARLIRADLPVDPVVREGWVGWRPTGATLIRAGRENLPFGLRTDEHLRYTRSVTRTDTNDDQQVGVAFVGTSRQFRGEGMAVAGNFAVSPDRFRERGAVGTVSWLPVPGLDLGLSGLMLQAEADPDTLRPRRRQAWGAHVRGSPVARLALAAEGDLLLDEDGIGGVGDLGLDVEAVRGLHLKGLGEGCAPTGGGAVGRVGVAGQWFFAPHTDLRVDGLYGPLRCEPDTEAFPMVAVQLHTWL